MCLWFNEKPESYLLHFFFGIKKKIIILKKKKNALEVLYYISASIEIEVAWPLMYIWQMFYDDQRKGFIAKSADWSQAFILPSLRPSDIFMHGIHINIQMRENSLW